MNTNLLYEYLKMRAEIEGRDFQLSQEFFDDNFIYGVRYFFGVLVDENCIPILDDYEPKYHSGLLRGFVSSYFRSIQEQESITSSLDLTNGLEGYYPNQAQSSTSPSQKDIVIVLNQ